MIFVFLNFFRSIQRSLIVRSTGYIIHLGPGSRVRHFGHFGRCKDTDLCFHVDIRSSLFSPPGIHDDHPVRSPHSVDGCCRSIFQDRKRFDIFGVQQVETSFHSIDQDQRVFVGTESTDSPDPELGTLPGFTASLHSNHTGQTPRQTVTDLSRRLFQFSHSDSRDRSDYTLFTLRSITDDNGFLDHFTGFFQLEINHIFFSQYHFLAFISDKRHRKDCISLRAVERIISGSIRCCSAGRFLKPYRSSDNGFSGLFIGNPSFHYPFMLLWRCRRIAGIGCKTT